MSIGGPHEVLPPHGISRDALQLALGHVDQAPQEAPGSMLVPVRAAHGVEEHSLAVDGAIERAPAPGDLHVGLVQGPGAAGVAAPLRAPPIREQRGEAALPGADRLVAVLKAAMEKPRRRPGRRAYRGDAGARRAARCRSGPGDR